MKITARIKFTEKEYAYIKDSFDLSKETVDAMSEDDLYDLQDKCSDIEVRAIQAAGDGDLSDDANTAAAIVTKIGFALCGDESDED